MLSLTPYAEPGAETNNSIVFLLWKIFSLANRIFFNEKQYGLAVANENAHKKLFRSEK